MQLFKAAQNVLISLVAGGWAIAVVLLLLLGRDTCESVEPVAGDVVFEHWASGHLMREGEDIRLLPRMADEFNCAGHRTLGGKRMIVKVFDVPSEIQAEYLTQRGYDGPPIPVPNTFDLRVSLASEPTIVTPSDDHWLVRVNHDVGVEMVNHMTAPTIVRPYIGIVTYEAMARCLGWPNKPIGYADIIALRANPEGWESYPCAKAEWGRKPLLAFTNPTTSSTGRSVLLSLFSFGSGKPPEALTLDDVNAPQVLGKVQEFNGLIDHYLIGTTVLNTKIYQGTRYGHFFIMPEDNLIHLYEGTETAYINGRRTSAPPIDRENPMVMIYPKEGSMPRNNCACVVSAAWVTEEQKEAADEWIKFLLEIKQQRSFMAGGFRPGTDLPLTDSASKITAYYGLNPAMPKEIDPSLIAPEVAKAIDASWEEVKRPGIVTFVVDTSVSMEGAKLAKVESGLARALNNMAHNNQVGLVTFGDSIDRPVTVSPWNAARFSVVDAVRAAKVGGEGALYDAVRAGIEMTSAATGTDNSIRSVIVLTDGQATRGDTQLDDLIRMHSYPDEVEIVSFSGFTGAVAFDNNGNAVPIENIRGTSLKIGTKGVQIFWVGVGDNADVHIGRLLAQATGAEFEATTDDALDIVLGETGSYQ